MILKNVITIFALVSATAVQALPEGIMERAIKEPPENVCDLVLWRKVRNTIHDEFGTGPCGALARASVRLAFHDAGTYDAVSDTGGANGSILRYREEAEQPQNNHLKTIIDALNRVYQRYAKNGVTRADIVQLAGVLGTVRCPGGPSIPFSIGRPDSIKPDIASNLPADTASADEVIAVFARMGLDSDEIVALLGSHTSAKRFSSNPRVDVNDKKGLALDSTPEIWDVKYYAETLQAPKNNLTETRIAADVKIAQHWKTAREFASYAKNQRKWNEHFSDAMVHMANLGHHKRQLVPCPIVPVSIRIPGDDSFEIEEPELPPPVCESPKPEEEEAPVLEEPELEEPELD